MNQSNEDIRMIVCPRPLSTTLDLVEISCPAGATVAEHLQAIGCQPDRMTALVYLDGRLIPKAEWDYAVPKVEQQLVVQAIPHGGGDGEGKSVLGIVAMIGLVVATWYIGGGAVAGMLPSLSGGWTASFLGGGIGAQALAGGLLIGGPLRINELILPSRDPLPESHA